MITLLTLGERLKKARKRRGLSQSQVSELTQISDKAISRYENNSSDPSPETLLKLCRLYDVSTEYVLGLTDVISASSDTSSDAIDSDDMIGKTDYASSAKRLLNFIKESPSKFHAVANIARRLENEGFTELKECEVWNIESGGKYYVTRNQSSVVALKIGDGDALGFNIIASHSDSPSFRIKPNAEMETLGEYIRLNTEKYGGMLMSTWLDRPLSVAGRVVTLNGFDMRSQLVNIDKDLLMIPNVAIHMQRNANDGMSYNPQTDTIPLMGSLSSKGELLRLAAESAGVKESDIVSSDLFLYNRMSGILWGNGGEFVSSPQLDDLQCAYASMQGFLAGGNEKTVSVLCVLDNEEVGSGTKQGADSDFLKTVLQRTADALGKPLCRMLPSSFVISADNAHAVHPNHPEYADPTNRPHINKGIVIKFNGNQRYATDAVSEAIFKSICRAADVPVQTYCNRSDIPGGSTLGNISTSQVSINTVDIGLAQLAMHSSYETAGAIDTLYLERACAEFYRTAIISNGDGKYKIMP